MDRLKHWSVSLLAGTGIGLFAYQGLSAQPGVSFVVGVLYLFATRLVLLHPELLVGPKTSLRTGSWGGLGAGLLAFTLYSFYSNLVPVTEDALVPVALVVFGLAIAMWGLGMQYQSALDRERGATSG